MSTVVGTKHINIPENMYLTVWGLGSREKEGFKCKSMFPNNSFRKFRYYDETIPNISLGGVMVEQVGIYFQLERQ